MWEEILQKLYGSKETPEILLLRQKVESVAQKLKYLQSIEPETDEDFHNIPLIIRYVKLVTELNIEIAEMYVTDVLE